MDDVDAVLAVNEAFYNAFEAGDLDGIVATWSHGDDVLCTHPGWAMLHGWDAVRESFERMAMGPSTQQFILTDPRAHVDGDTAWVSVEENLLGTRTSTVAAVNIFRRQADGWRMIAHHASPVLAAR